MQYLQKSFSVFGGKIDCCEACVFHRGPHSPDCPKWKQPEVVSGPQLAPGQSVEEFCNLYQSAS